MKSIVLGTGLFLGVAGGAAAQVNSQDLKWGPTPPVFEKGAQMALLLGDPSKAGPFVIRLKMPAGYKVAAHHHPTDEYVTVLEGEVSLGMGDKLDPTKGAALYPGGFAKAPANMNRYAWSKAGGVIQVSAEGPFVLIYANPADDPTKR
jgi:hypothetical protein